MATKKRPAQSPGRWEDLNTAISEKYASYIAQSCGLQVSVASGTSGGGFGKTVIVWRGSEAQFRETGFIAPGFQFNLKNCRWFCPAWLRGSLYREGKDLFRYEIAFSHTLNSREKKKVVCKALSDENYQQFRAKTLVPVDVGCLE
jgi:hypothetical protein